MTEHESPERCCTRCGDGDLYPRRCSQCGQRWADQACGPTHALIADELGLGDLRRELGDAQQDVTKLDRMRAYLATEVLGLTPGQAVTDRDLLWQVRVSQWAGPVAVENRDGRGTPLPMEELLAEFAGMPEPSGGA